jgi:hypothetical protein
VSAIEREGLEKVDSRTGMSALPDAYGRALADLWPTGRPKGDARKVRIAQRLRRDTTMTLGWIAERLYMGAPGHGSCLLSREEGKAS